MALIGAWGRAIGTLVILLLLLVITSKLGSKNCPRACSGAASC